MSYEDTVFKKYLRSLLSGQDPATEKNNSVKVNKVSKIFTFILKYTVLVNIQTIMVDVQFKLLSNCISF